LRFLKPARNQWHDGRQPHIYQRHPCNLITKVVLLLPPLLRRREQLLLLLTIPPPPPHHHLAAAAAIAQQEKRGREGKAYLVGAEPERSSGRGTGAGARPDRDGASDESFGDMGDARDRDGAEDRDSDLLLLLLSLQVAR
jgi:hypothetical protein